MMERWFILGLVVAADRPEIKDDANDVITSPGYPFEMSMLNISNPPNLDADYGQITTCTRDPIEWAPADFWADGAVTDETLHNFKLIPRGKMESVFDYDNSKCNAKIMHILAKSACKSTATHTTAVHSKYFIQDESFFKATEQLLNHDFKTDHGDHLCGYLMGPETKGRGYYHLWQYFGDAATHSDDAFVAWKAVRNGAAKDGKKWIKLSNLVNQDTPGFFPITLKDKTANPTADKSGSTLLDVAQESAQTSAWTLPLAALEAAGEKSHVQLILCSLEPFNDFDTRATAKSGTIFYFQEKVLDVQPWGNRVPAPKPHVHGLILSPSRIEHDDFPNCRKTSMQVLFDHKPQHAVTDQTWFYHHEYEIPAVTHLLFEHAIYEYFTASTTLVFGAALSNNIEWNGFFYYHIIMIVDMSGQASDAWSKFKVERNYAKQKGADWMKLDDHTNDKSPPLKTV